MQDIYFISAQRLLSDLVFFIPNLIEFALIILIGLFTAQLLALIVEKAINFIKLDKFLKGLKVDQYLSKLKLGLDSGKFLGAVIYWIVILLLVMTVSDRFGFYALSDFIDRAIAYIPNLIVSVVILMVAVLAADFVKGAVKSSAMGAKIRSAKLLGMMVWWVVIIFGLMTALGQLGINLEFIQSVITSLIMGVALAFGLAFGLGGKDYAQHLIEKIKDEAENRE
ncbi:MAG: hypothetical protein KY053_01420 [Candidatus Liptonbacteria bacterium]|nr:hypothetical protein [Candidatus Liptonbacteria bacterium]